VTISSRPTITLGASPARVDPGYRFAIGANVSGGSDPIGPPTWSFGDGGTATGALVDHAYSAPGNYTVTVPAGFTGNFCWNTTAPSGVASQNVIVHIWELSGGNFLLYQKGLALSNTSGTQAPGGGAGPGGGWPSGLLGPLYFGWFSPLLFGIGVVVVAAVLLAAARRKSRRRAAYAATAETTTVTAEGRAPPADSAASYGPGR
jgi:hypothetical protein